MTPVPDIRLRHPTPADTAALADLHIETWRKVLTREKPNN